MSLGVRIIFVLTAIAASAFGQRQLGVDHFLPPPPGRFASSPRDGISGSILGERGNGGQSAKFSYPDLLQRNPFLSRAYGRSWFRTNFEDLFSNRDLRKLEWFEVLEGNNCSPVPATVNAGRPPRDICVEAAVNERRCICLNTGRGNTETGYEPICGNCRDPCALRFTPDKVPRYLQRLAIEDAEEDFDDRRK